MNKIFLLLSLFLCTLNSFSQNSDTTHIDKKDALKIYLDIYHNVTFVKENITFVNYVRDLKDADVHILETIQEVGGGGFEFTYIFTGNKHFTGKNDTLKFHTSADNTTDEIRNQQVKYLKIGLLPYASHTPFIKQLDVNFDGISENETPEDKWKSWVFNIDASANINGEDSYQQYYLNSSVSAEKVTEKWKIEIDYSKYKNLSYFYLEDDTVFSSTNTNYFRTLVARSIGEHWAVGFNGDFGNSTYNNKQIFTGFWPTLEYNVFPYSKSNIVQLRFQYLVGPKYYKYYDTTIFNKTEELLFSERLGVAFAINKKWGSINTSISAEHYFHDFSKHRLNFDNELNIRVVKGLSVFLYGNYAIIQDQIFLPKGDLSYEEILLQQKQASTSFSFWAFVGFSYSFGSIYNNVVNPRFNSIY